MNKAALREIPYNYTSLTDEDIVVRFLSDESWSLIDSLRHERETGRSARMLFEVLGDIWVVTRNPYIQDDLMHNRKRWGALLQALAHRLDQIEQRGAKHAAVKALVQQTREAVSRFAQQFEAEQQLRQKAQKQLRKATAADNICFDGLSRVAHVTDATDWRVEYPFVVIKPDFEAEIQPLIKICIALGLTIIPRGGGTGYTGGAIPLYPQTAVINTEKLTRLSPVKKVGEHCAIDAEAGVITGTVAISATQADCIFAVDPTSQEACTIGGNIAMNAGGKKAVLWGTTIDNLLSWRMVTPRGTWLEVKRIGHPGRKIEPADSVQFSLTETDTLGSESLAPPETLTIPGGAFRKKGLGKDVTNKALFELPGIQKEGCDGFITSASFILHRRPQYTRTFCLEFFGDDLQKAVPAIIEIKEYIAKTNVMLTGLEHLDERYIRAVGYDTKSPRTTRPKMLLLGDIAGFDEREVAEVTSMVVQIANAREGEGFVAVSPQARAAFWEDRKRTARIAAHTNAFKINEDVVIPLENLADYSLAIERINIEQALENKLLIAGALRSYLQESLITTVRPSLDEEQLRLVEEKLKTVLSELETVIQTWQAYYDNLDQDLALFESLQKRRRVVSYHESVEKLLFTTFAGDVFEPVRAEIKAIHQRHLRQKIFIATHMHAGDGNVHTNIPVHSSDHDMLARAASIVSRIMTLAQDLDGVISGEHGIGITKLDYLDPELKTQFAAYKKKIDPNHHFNRGKLIEDNVMARAYTPSLALVEQEALLLDASALGEINNDIKDCLRCGKCKPHCMTHIPSANLFYSPRDKILATGLITEAFLYEEQTRRGISLHHFDEMNDIADHCTTCHKCFNPCPVNIDFGEVSIKMRTLLQKRGNRRMNFGTKLSMQFLTLTDPLLIKVMRQVMLRVGFKLQRWVYKRARQLQLIREPKVPAATTKKPAIKEQVIHFMRRPLPRDLPSKTTRALLGLEDNKVVPIIRDVKKMDDSSEAVFYFPGCGSERLFSEVGLATLAMLYHVGVKAVLPPGYLCCGYPQAAEGLEEEANAIDVNNQVLFHRVANTLNYLDIKTVIVSCGTCIDQLQKYQFEKIFPGCRLLDIHEYLLEKEVCLQSESTTQYLYHDPCHSPIKNEVPIVVAQKLMGQEVVLTKRCCGDAGMLSLSRPDIAMQLRSQKEVQIRAGIKELTGKEEVKKGRVKILTTCPACVKGLSSYADRTNTTTDYIVVELAEQMLGHRWQQQFIDSCQQGGIERILL